MTVSQTHTEPKNTPAATTPPTMPRWVKISGLIIVVIILLFAALHLSGAHGPASHMSMGEPATSEGGHTP
jgi:hypothetical protein